MHAAQYSFSNFDKVSAGFIVKSESELTRQPAVWSSRLEAVFIVPTTHLNA